MGEKASNIFRPYLLKIPMSNFEVLIHDVELLSNKTSEFKHVHNSFEIYYAVKGNLKIMISDDEVNVPANHLLLLGPGTWHGTIYEPNVYRQYFIIIFDIIENTSTCDDNTLSEHETLALQKVLEDIKTNHYCVTNDEFHCTEIINQIIAELENKNFGWQSMLNSLYIEFIIFSLRNLIPSTYFDTSEETRSNVNMAIKITKYMHKNYNRNITLQEVAKVMHVSERHINRVFEACFGTTFSKTLSIYRLNYAKDYLYKTDYSVEKIANLVGFSSSRTLLRLFREIEGMTTTEYRNRVRNPKK